MNDINNCDYSDWLYVIRRVRNKPNFIKSGGFSSALFKDSKGVSVNKDHRRTEEEIIEDEIRLHNFYNNENTAGFYSDEKKLKAIVSIDKEICEQKNIKVLDDPLEENPHHALLQKSENEITLTSSQAKALARNARIIVNFDI